MYMNILQRNRDCLNHHSAKTHMRSSKHWKKNAGAGVFMSLPVSPLASTAQRLHPADEEDATYGPYDDCECAAFK